MFSQGSVQTILPAMKNRRGGRLSGSYANKINEKGPKIPLNYANWYKITPLLPFGPKMPLTSTFWLYFAPHL